MPGGSAARDCVPIDVPPPDWLDRGFAAQRPLRLERIAIEAPLRVLVLAPHPDDFDAIAVTLRHLHRHGATIELAVLTGGASGVEDGYGGAHDDAAKAALREAEQRASCAAFGLPDERCAFVRLAEDARGHPLDDDANRNAVRALLRRHRPDLVFMPHGHDSNVGHQRVFALFDAAARAEGLAAWACLNRDAKTIAMTTDLVTAFDDDAARWKAGLLRLHASQQQRNLRSRGHGFDERVLAVNRDAAREAGAGLPYAETFELRRYAAA